MKLLSNPLYVAWDTTYRCNLHCIHCCFGELNNKIEYSKELTTQEAKKLLDELAEIKIASLQFAGGEPFVREDFLQLIEYASDMPYARSIATNGMFISQDVAKQLKDCNICNVQISLDGSTQGIHEYIRGKGTYSKTVNAIKQLVKNGIPVVVATLLSRHNINNVTKMLSFLFDLGVDTFRLQFLMPEGNAKNIYNELLLKPFQIKETVEMLENHEIIKQNKMTLALPCFYTGSRKNIDSVVFSNYIVNSCGAGCINMNISASGNVTACGILTSEEWSCGNIREQTISDIWKNEKFNMWRTPIQFTGKCGTCPSVKACMGGCRASAYLIEGDFYAGDPLCCEKHK